MKVIIFTIFSLVLGTGTALYAESSIDSNAGVTSVEFTNYEQIASIAEPERPIESGLAALDYVLSQPATREDLEYAIKNNDGKWKAEAKFVDHVWAVRIHNQNVKHPYICFFEFNSSGKFLPSQPWSGCEYSK